MKTVFGRDAVSLDSLFAEKGFTPNSNQKLAIENTSGPLLLTAGPGSGKTRVLLWRCVNLIVFENIPPEEIFLATFTEKAALQLKQGLQGLLSIASTFTHKPYDIAEMYVGTLHSLCQKLLTDRRFREHGLRSRRPLIMDDLGQFLFVREHFNNLLSESGFDIEKPTDVYKEINGWFGKASPSRTDAISNCISFFNRMSEEDFGEEELSLKLRDRTISKLFKMTILYRQLLSEKGFDRVDFSSLQQRAYEYICQKKDAGSVFKHVIVDEYQDTNTIQQKIYLKLAEGTKNICVVGDDDQALYRFRGATVENLVDFENICKKEIGVRPKRIDLNINYRSRKQIVDTYTQFIDLVSWKNPSKPSEFFRIQNKDIQANSKDANTSVVLETGDKQTVTENIASLIKKLKRTGKIKDYNQCAILFPTIRGNASGEMSPKVQAFADALEEAGIKYYAPRAKNFLYTEESLITFGLFAKIFGYSPSGITYGGMADFSNWAEMAIDSADEIIEQDKPLAKFIEDTQQSIKASRQNYKYLSDYCEKNGIDLDDDLTIPLLKKFSQIQRIDDSVRRTLVNRGMLAFTTRRTNEGKPLHVSYALSRATAMDWTLLDLFYKLNSFEYFAEKYRQAEDGGEDSGLYNLGMITKYIAQYHETANPILSGATFAKDLVRKIFFGSYMYSLFRLNETEYEDSEDPFPKGCVPFLTVHQSKGLEFPVVILGSVSHKSKDARTLDVLVRSMQQKMGIMPTICEPLDSMDTYDTMRMFYVALSRAKNLLVLSQFKGQGQTTYNPFKALIEQINFESIKKLDVKTLPDSEDNSDKLPHVYTYTADYLPYNNCPRNYMVFHKYGFVPSRSQTMFFGSLVHQTVEDLQNFVMEDR
ncbi:ATP-dependent helicase [Fibrobacter sp. UWB5]|uniref:ATP-dependent helicase n=1 Tax=Fibrobacter sp. UWB5 TaxID=1964360 RepID=UPI001185AAA8|nr:ATP-dependent helicase [Fibrobacter sp. UWB5]